jgi:hypothetical protein
MTQSLVKPTKRVCNRCGIIKEITEFYTHRSHCITCHNHCEYKLELYPCHVCNIVIRKAHKNKHEKSRRHQKCWFFNEQFDADRLQKQNSRMN